MTSPDESRITRPLRVAALLLAVLGIFPLAALIKWAPVVQWLPRAGVEYLVSATVAIGLIAALSRSSAAHRLLDRARTVLLGPAPREFSAWLILFTGVAAVLVGWYCFGLQPIGGDEMSQRFQERILRSGRWSAVAEQDFEFFSGIQSANVDGRWFSQFPIGGPLLLLVGALIGMPWLVNALLAGWTAVLLYRYAAQVADETTARVAAILFATSPFVLLMSGTQMNHAGSLAFMMLAISRLPEWARTDAARERNRTAFIIGLGVAVSAAIRPYDAAIFALVIGVYQLILAQRDRAKIASFGAQLLGGAIPLALLLYVNYRQTGQPLLFGYDALNGESHRPGFHRDPTGNEFTPIQGLHHISSYLLYLNVSLFEGPIPALVLIVGALALLRKATEWDHLNVALIGALLVGYAGYWAESFFYGPRFLYMALPLFVLFAARLPEAVAPYDARFARFVLPVVLLLAWLQPPVAKYQGVWSTLAATRAARPTGLTELAAEIRDAGLENALVFVHESWHGRLTARLRAIGAPALTAEKIVSEFDACALHFGLEAEDLQPGPPSTARWNRVVRRALMAGPAQRVMSETGDGTAIALAGGRLHPACNDEWFADRKGSTPLDGFQHFQTFGSDGRLAGNIVFARDFGIRNQKLLGRFGDRTWYRYRPRTGPNDFDPVFVPYRER